jgi:hypothetical protein
VFVPGKLFRPSLMFLVKQEPTLLKTRLERLARDIHSSL